MAELNTDDYVWMGRNPNVKVMHVNSGPYPHYPPALQVPIMDELMDRLIDYSVACDERGEPLTNDVRICTSDPLILRGLGGTKEGDEGEHINVQAYDGRKALVHVSRGDFMLSNRVKPGPIKDYDAPLSVGVSSLGIVNIEGVDYLYHAFSDKYGNMTRFGYLKEPDFEGDGDPCERALERKYGAERINTQTHARQGLLQSRNQGAVMVAYRSDLDREDMIERFDLQEKRDGVIRLVAKGSERRPGPKRFLYPVEQLPVLIDRFGDKINSWSSMQLIKLMEET